MTCIDLKARFGNKYRIQRDQSAGPKTQDPWYWLIPCKYGEIYPHGDDLLAVLVNSIRVANRMRSWPELRVHQDADDGVIFLFSTDHFGRVAKRIGARKKKQLSAKRLKQLRESGSAALKRWRMRTMEGSSETQNERSRRTSIPESTYREIARKSNDLPYAEGAVDGSGCGEPTA